ncbi:hypothetical protein JCM21900_000292 [Sporobolomyces salmonicolor]
MPVLLRLPENAKATLVVIRRPITFTIALGFALVAFLTSVFYSFTRLEPLECPCSHSDDQPRTRPRPLPAAPLTPPRPKRQTALQSLSSFVAASFRPPRPPPARRQSARTHSLDYPYHELDEVVEETREEEDEEDAPPQQRALARTPIDEGDVAPALTPDGGSEADTTSDVETVEDDDVELAARRQERARALTVLTGLRWKRSSTGAATGKAEATSPIEEDESGSPTSGARHGKAFPCAAALVRRATRPHAATISGSSSSHRFVPSRHQGAEAVDYFSGSPAISPTSPTSSTFTSSSTDTIDLPSLRSRKAIPSSTSAILARAPFRSLSPLSRSPITSPEPSPPPSPRLIPSRSLSLSRVLPKPKRANSLKTAPPSSRGRRSRSVSPLPASMPRLRRGTSAGPGVDGLDPSGSSGLALSDVI